MTLNDCKRLLELAEKATKFDDGQLNYGFTVEACNLAPELAAIALLAIELGEALRPFADLVPGPLDNVGGGTLIAPTIKVRWIKEAREVLAKLSLAQESKL